MASDYFFHWSFKIWQYDTYFFPLLFSVLKINDVSIHPATPKGTVPNNQNIASRHWFCDVSWGWEKVWTTHIQHDGEVQFLQFSEGLQRREQWWQHLRSDSPPLFLSCWSSFLFFSPVIHKDSWIEYIHTVFVSEGRNRWLPFFCPFSSTSSVRWM